MPARGQLKPGSIAAQIVAQIEAGAGEPVSRNELGRALVGRDRHWLGRTLGTLQRSGLIKELPGGYRLTDGPLPAEAPIYERPVRRVPAPLRSALAPILERARHLRAVGQPCRAQVLLQRAAEKVSLPFVAEDLLALSDLFGRAGEPYRDLDLQARAAA